MAADELTKALLLEEIAPPRSVGGALFASVTGGVPLLQALVDSGAVSPDVLARYLARTDAPLLRHVVPVPELVGRLPPGLCDRLLAIPVRRDAITGTVDVVVADPADPHPASEIAFHLGAPVRAVRAPISAIEEALRRLRMPSRDHAGAAPTAASRTDGAPPYPAEARPRLQTSPWGTPVRQLTAPMQRTPASDPPHGGYGSEIPIPLTRKTFHPSMPLTRGGTERPPALTRGLGEGYAFDATNLRDVVEKAAPAASLFAMGQPIGSFIPGPPPLPGASAAQALAPDLPLPEMRGVVAALLRAGSRDEVLELVLAGAQTVALKVALFVVKRGGYLGWVATPELADRAALQSVLIPLDADSVFDRAVREDLYLGPIRHDEVHAPLLRVLRHPSRDVAVVPIRVSGKTAVIIVADALADTMVGTRRLEELARAAGEAFARIVRARR